MTAVHKFLVPFAGSGDKADIPVTIQSDGSVSFPEGWGFDYSRNPSTDPLAKRIDRATFNHLMYAITSALGQLQTQGAPDWITAVENGGAAYPYAARAMVRYGSAVYQSLVDNNTATPGTDAAKWAVFDASPVPDATTTVKGKVELATVAEAVAGLLSNVAVTPDGLAAAISAFPDATTTAKGKVKLATDAEAAAMVLSDRVLTPANMAALFGKSLATNGYQKMPGGIIIQWGSLNLTSTMTNYNFPIAFPSAALQIIIADAGGGSATAVAANVVTPSQFAGIAAVNPTLSAYIAIGY